MISKLTLILFLFSLHATAQDGVITVSGKDAGFMRSHANKIVGELNNLLSLVTTEGEPSEIDEFIAGSYSPGKSQIFLNKDIRINEDIDPLSTSNIAGEDIAADKYLSYLNLQYKKSKTGSIDLTLLKTSFPKKGIDADTPYLYVKVYFSSFFKNKHINNEDEYKKTNRYAEIRMIKENGIWKGYIDRIGFFTTADTTENFSLHDINLSGNGAANDSSTNAIEMKLMRDAEQHQFEIDRKTKEEYKSLINKGDSALDAKDYTNPFIFYHEAQELLPTEPLAHQKIKKANAEKAAANYSKKDIAENYLADAAKEELKRDYSKAITSYNKAIDANPELRITYQSKIDELNKKWDVVSVLQDKFNVGQIDPTILIAEYDKALKKDKENSDLYFGRALCYNKLNNTDKAIKDCNNALEKDSRNIPALKLKAGLEADLYQKLGDYKKYITMDDTDSSIYELLSDLCLKIKPGDNDNAINYLNDGIKINDKWPNLHYKKGILLLNKHDAQNAKLSFSKAIARNDFYSDAYFQRGIAEVQLNVLQDAAIDFNKALDRHPDTAKQQIINRYANDYYLRSNAKFDEGKTDSALLYIDFVIALSPGSSQYHFNRGRFLNKLKKYEDAERALGKAMVKDAGNTEIYYQLGLARAGQEKWDDAIAAYKKSIDLNGHHLYARKSLADAYFAEENIPEAIKSYVGFLETYDATKDLSAAVILPDVYNALGRSYFLQNNSDDKALVNFKNALNNKNDFAEAYFNEGNYYYVNKDLTNAIKDLETAVKYDKKNTLWAYTLANAYFAEGKREDYVSAANYYNSVITSNKYPNAFYQLGTCYLKMQDFDHAISNYLKLQSNGLGNINPLFNYNIGYAYLNVSRIDSASIYLQKAFLTDSLNERVMYVYGIAQWQSNNPNEAMRLFEKVLQTGKIKSEEIKSDPLVAGFKEDQRFRNLFKNGE